MVKSIISRFAVELDPGYKEPNSHIYGLLNPLIDPKTQQQEEAVWAQELWGIIADKWALHEKSIRSAACYWFNHHVPNFLQEMHQTLLTDQNFLHIRARDMILWIFESGHIGNAAYDDVIVMPSFALKYDESTGYTTKPLTKEQVKSSGAYLTIKNLLQLILIEKGLKGTSNGTIPEQVAERFSGELERRLIFRDQENFAEIPNASALIEELL